MMSKNKTTEECKDLTKKKGVTFEETTTVI